MKIEVLGQEKISVALSKTDMENLDITYDELDYSNIETRRVIWTVLGKAGEDLGKSFNPDSRLLIEVLPESDGGCVLFFTFAPPMSREKRRLIMKKDADTLLFCAFDENAFLDSLALLKNQTQTIKSLEIYSFENRFFAVISTVAREFEKLTHCLKDYGNIFADNSEFLARIREYGKKIPLEP